MPLCAADADRQPDDLARIKHVHERYLRVYAKYIFKYIAAASADTGLECRLQNLGV